MHFEAHLIIFGLITVVCAERSIDLTKCYRNTNKNCEPFSFRRTSQNVTNAPNQTIAAKHLKTDTMESIDVIENQLAFDESTTQEEGNCLNETFIAFESSAVKIENNRKKCVLQIAPIDSNCDCVNE